MSKSENMLKTAGFMAIATLLAKVCGLAREMLIAAFFSTGYLGEAYLAATQLPMTLFDIVIGGVISASFIPIFNDLLQKKNREEAMRFANNFIGMILTVCTLITVVGILFSDQLITLLAPDFNTETHQLASQLSMIMFPMIIFTGLAFSFVGILQSFGEFNIPAIMSLLSNLCVILYFPLFGKRFGVHGLAVAMLISWSIQVFVQIPALRRFSFHFCPRLHMTDPDIRRALVLAGPMLVSTWVQPLYSIVNTRIASGISGAVATLNYANRLYIVVTGVFSFVVTNLIFPKLSRANSAENQEESRKLVLISLKSVAMVILPLMAGFILLSEPIISVIYEHGKFDATKITAAALSCYSVGMIGLSVNEVLSKTFFSMQDSKTPMVNAILSMLFNILLAYTLSPVFGVCGLALASAGGSTVNAALNYYCMRKKHGKICDLRDIADFIKIIGSALLMSAAVFGVRELLKLKLSDGLVSNLILGGGCAVAGVIVYAAALYLLKETEIRDLLKGGKKHD